MSSRKATPPPVIGKAGRYTVFITPSSAPEPLSKSYRSQNPSPGSVLSPKFSSNLGASRFSNSSFSNGVGDLKSEERSPVKVCSPPPVVVPPPQFEKVKGGRCSTSVFGFFWDAVAKVQDAHSSLDQYLSDWLGLDQSRYQWALNDYYENDGSLSEGKGCDVPKHVAGKGYSNSI